MSLFIAISIVDINGNNIFAPDWQTRLHSSAPSKRKQIHGLYSSHTLTRHLWDHEVVCSGGSIKQINIACHSELNLIKTSNVLRI
jgi:hypothetical protein